MNNTSPPRHVNDSKTEDLKQKCIVLADQILKLEESISRKQAELKLSQSMETFLEERIQEMNAVVKSEEAKLNAMQIEICQKAESFFKEENCYNISLDAMSDLATDSVTEDQRKAAEDQGNISASEFYLELLQGKLQQKHAQLEKLQAATN